MSIRILLFGAHGWIGNQLLHLLQVHPHIEVITIATSRPQYVEDLRAELDQVQPTHVVSTIGRTHGQINQIEIPTIDYLEYPGKLQENVCDNLYAPLVLAHECTKRNIHYTYLGTGCIFEYDDNHPMENTSIGFTENDRPNFFGSSYSIVKGYTDQLMHLYDTHTLNVRIRMPITAEPNPRDFITKICNYERICSMPNSMTVLDELLPLLVDMIVTRRTGTIQLTNPGTISHEEILTLYKEICDHNKTWKTMSYDDQTQLLKSKRSNNSLDTTLLQTWYPEVSDIHTAIYTTLVKRKQLYNVL
jgi:dTDP-4-dehydrorhamnose reductase